MQTSDLWSLYVCTAYAVLLLICTAGAFSRAYAANLAQRVALGMFALWSAWRIELVLRYGWGYPHEPMVASALLLYALGSLFKTWTWRRRVKRGGMRHGDV